MALCGEPSSIIRSMREYRGGTDGKYKIVSEGYPILSISLGTVALKPKNEVFLMSIRPREDDEDDVWAWDVDDLLPLLEDMDFLVDM